MMAMLLRATVRQIFLKIQIFLTYSKFQLSKKIRYLLMSANQ